MIALRRGYTFTPCSGCRTAAASSATRKILAFHDFSGRRRAENQRPTVSARPPLHDTGSHDLHLGFGHSLAKRPSHRECRAKKRTLHLDSQVVTAPPRRTSRKRPLVEHTSTLDPHLRFGIELAGGGTRLAERAVECLESSVGPRKLNRLSRVRARSARPRATARELANTCLPSSQDVRGRLCCRHSSPAFARSSGKSGGLQLQMGVPLLSFVEVMSDAALHKFVLQR